MKVVIFGASGKTGQHLVAQALQQGHQVTAFVRNRAKLALSHPQLVVVQGNVNNYQQVEKAIQHQDAVLSALGVSKVLKSDPDVVNGIRHIIQAMEKERVQRLIYQSTFGVHENRNELGFLVNRVIGYILRNEIADHEAKEKIIQKSAVEYVIVRPSTLTNGSYTGAYRHGERIVMNKFISPISRADVADFMLKQLTGNSYLYKTPRIMS